MPINNINIGTAANNGTGEGLRLGGQKINANFAYLKQYADNLIQGNKWKNIVDAATTANITLSGEQTIDGVTTSASRVLVKDQTNKTENGIYLTGAGAWTRTTDADTGPKLVNATVSVKTINANEFLNWTCNAENITLGSTDIEFVPFQGSDGIDQGTFDAAIQIINDSLAEKADADHTHTADDVTETATKKWTSPTEKNTWNGKETTTGAQSKADAAQTAAEQYADAAVADLELDVVENADNIANHELRITDLEENPSSGGVQSVTGTAVDNTDPLNPVVDIPAGSGGGLILFNVEDYGAVHNGSTDDTVAIQNTINAAFSAGGGIVYFPKGIYIIGGALQTNIGGVNYNSQLYIPQVNFNDPARCTIKFLGEVPPNMFQSAGIGTSVAPNSGVILRSTIQGAGTEPAIVCNKGAAGNAEGLSFTDFQAENIALQYTPNVNNKCTIGGFNCYWSANASFNFVTCYPYNLNLVNSGEPDVITVAGISLPKVRAEHFCSITNATVGGYTHGYVFGDHGYGDNIVANTCKHGFVLKNVAVPVHLQKISAFWCKYDITFIEAWSRIKVGLLNNEWKSQGKWYDSVAAVYDPNNYAQGRINFDMNEAAVGLNQNLFKKVGGNKLICTPNCVDVSVNINDTTYTLKYIDAFKNNFLSNATDQTITVPNDTACTWDIGQEITLRRQGPGNVIIQGDSGVSINVPNGYISHIANQYDAVTLVKNAANSYTIYGALKTAP